jgi:methylmalonyl-CoA mutase N-terminal domain/subunit
MANERVRFLYQNGGTAWTLAPDSPMQAGLDPDFPPARYGVGLNGVSICRLKDMEDYLEGLPIGKIAPTLTVSQPASAFLLAAYVLTAEKQGIGPDQLLGGIQNDCMNQIGGGLRETDCTWFPNLDVGVRLTCDVIEWTALHAPKLNNFCVNCYNMREHGITAAEEIAFGITAHTALIRNVLSRGRVKVDDFVPRMSFFCASGMDFLEEIAKFRAFRRMYARAINDEFHPQNPRTCWFRCAVQTSGISLTTQQPLNNIVRASIEALASVLGGVQSMFPSCFDEGSALPNELAAVIALRTQQIIAHETNVVNTIDPLAGSYAIEALTDKLEEEAGKIIAEIEAEGGGVEYIKKGFKDKRLLAGKERFQRQIQSGERIVVGVNAFEEETETSFSKELEIPGGIFEVPYEVMDQHIEEVKEFKRSRDNDATKRVLDKLRQKAETDENLIPAIIEVVRANGTLGEIGDVLRESVGFKMKVSA